MPRRRRSNLLQTAQRFRRDLLKQDVEAARALTAAYVPAHRAIKAQLAAIQSKIADAEAAGKPLGRSWLFQEQRAQTLERQIQQAMRAFSPQAAKIVAANQRTKATMGIANSRELTAAAAGRRGPHILATWSNLPASAMEDLVGFAADGSPLRQLFDELGPQVSKAIRDELATGLALGRNPNRIAARVNARSGMGLARATTISRTEALRAYRESTRRSFEQSGVVTSWRWLSARDENTCPACWAMDGDTFDTNETMAAHPNCRCTMTPVVAGGYDIGVGADEFDQLSASTQRQILGPGKHEAFAQGKIGLKDLVVHRHSADWGTSVQVGSLDQALSRAAG